MKLAQVKTVSSKENIFVAITSPDKPEITEELQGKWQKILDLAAKIIGVPSGLITRLNEKTLEVFLTSKTENNIFVARSQFDLGLGWYCENVTGTRNPLIVSNALESENWKDNPSVPFNMISYMGIPIQWPDGEIFGTFCMIDNKENKYSETYKDLLISFREIVQNDLKSILLFQNAQNDILSKEAQIKEVHHRVKNHFTLLISTLCLQSMHDSNKNVNSIIMDIQSRISAISLIHDNLYRSTHSGSGMMRLGNYLNELGKNILATLQRKKVKFIFHSDEIIVIPNVSVPCGLILNELITNSVKYAFKNVKSPEINVKVSLDIPGEINFAYRDNGGGLPDDFKIESSTSLGMLLIVQTVKQLGGRYAISNDNGFVFSMTFKANQC